MSRGDQLGRQWRIIQILLSSKYGISVAELADEIDCMPRTVYRDLEALQVAGFPIYNNRSEGKSLWGLLEEVKQQIPIPFSLTELMALYFSRDMLKPLKDTVFYDSLETLFKKIKATLPPESIKFLSNVQDAIHVKPKSYKDYSKFKVIIDNLNEATISHKSVEIVYFTMHSKKENLRKVDPYKIWFFNDTFYLVGHCHLRGEIRMFVLDRIKSLNMTEDSFTVPTDFSMEDFMKSSFGVFKGKPERVKVLFASDVAGYIEERVWHPSQKIHRQKDGALLFEAEVAVTEDLKSWIMSWGSKAIVVAPSSLKKELLSEAMKAVENFKEALKGIE